MQEQPPRVVIRPDNDPGTVFPSVGVTRSQLVFWANNDSVAHLPVGPAGAFIGLTAIQPGTTSNTQAPGNALKTLVPGGLSQGQVYTLNYQCSLHPGESGVMELVNDFYPPDLQITVTRDSTTKIFPSVPLITGGKPPYTFTIAYSELPSTAIVVDGGNAGPLLSGSSDTAGTFLLRITMQDALSNVLDSETFQITIN